MRPTALETGVSASTAVLCCSDSDNIALPNTTGKLTPSLHFMQDTETKHGDIMEVIILTFNLGKV